MKRKFPASIEVDCEGNSAEVILSLAPGIRATTIFNQQRDGTWKVFPTEGIELMFKDLVTRLNNPERRT
jgi:ketosteroid isomerase-like protein